MTKNTRVFRNIQEREPKITQIKQPENEGKQDIKPWVLEGQLCVSMSGKPDETLTTKMFPGSSISSRQKTNTSFYLAQHPNSTECLSTRSHSPTQQQ